MYNISKLSDMSRTFVATVKAGACANIAAAKAVANSLGLPSGPVEDPEVHFREIHLGAARQLVSDLNEVVTINAREVMVLVQSFWKARYGVAYPERIQPLNMPETCYAFFGYGMYVPGDALQEIEKGGNSLIRMLNGFTAVVMDLTYVAAQQPDVVQTVEQAPVVAG